MEALTNSGTGTPRPGWVEFTHQPEDSSQINPCPALAPPTATSHPGTEQLAPPTSWVMFDAPPWSVVSGLCAAQVKAGSLFQEDEGIDMDPFQSPPSTGQSQASANHIRSNGKSDTGTSRFASWVTFDDGELGALDRPCHISDSPSHAPYQETSDGTSAPPGQNLLDLSPAGSAPYDRKNPFLHDDFAHVQPSPINPFSAFFSDSQDVSLTSLSNSASAVSFDSPFFQVDGGAQGNSPKTASPFGQVAPGDGSSGQEGELEQLRALWIGDPDEPGDDSWEPEDEGGPYLPDHMTPQDGWLMMLRIPEKKNIMSSRHWGPIFVRLAPPDDPPARLQMFYERGLEKPFREVGLDARLEVSEHRLQSYEESARVHTLSLDTVVYRERRRIQSRAALAHLPIREQLVKLGTTCYRDYLSFRHALLDQLMQLPPEMSSAAPVFSEEEVHVEVRDEFHGVVAKGDGRILKQLVLTRVYVLAFLATPTSCHLGLNNVEVKGKEVVSRHNIVPNTTRRWIRLRDCQLHALVDRAEFSESRALAFTPSSGQRVELLRFSTPFGERSLPFTLRTVASLHGAQVEIQSWLVMASGFSSNREALAVIPCENVMVRYPIPELWALNFRREGVMGEKSLKARFNKSASFGSAGASGSEPVMRVTLGSAKYEQAFNSVVWRITRLPDKNSALGHPHTFFCHLELASDRDVPEAFQRHLEVEFDMPAATASKATVRSLSVGDKAHVKKWITYKSHYSYEVPIERNGDSEQPGECVQQ